jgi:hypothetical protein
VIFVLTPLTPSSEVYSDVSAALSPCSKGLVRRFCGSYTAYLGFIPTFWRLLHCVVKVYSDVSAAILPGSEGLARRFGSFYTV